MIKGATLLSKFTYSEDRIEYTEADEPNYDDEACEETCTSGYFITQADLEAALRDAFEAGRECGGQWNCFEKYKSTDQYIEELKNGK